MEMFSEIDGPFVVREDGPQGGAGRPRPMKACCSPPALVCAHFSECVLS